MSTQKKNQDGSFPRYVLVGVAGNAFYDLGFAAEYRLIQVWRAVRDGGLFFAQIMAWLFSTLFGWLVTLLQNLWQDVTTPFRHLSRQKRQLENMRQRAWEFGYKHTEVPGFAGVRFKNALRFISAIVAFLLPLAAAAALVLTVRNVINMQYALAVEIDGKVIGYVADQTVVDSAKSLLRDRIKLAGNQEISDWQLNPTYTIARAANYTTTQQLVNEILRTGSKNPGDIVSATGLYINNELYAVTDNGPELKRYLDSYLQQQAENAEEGATVSYVRAIECDPESEDVFFSTSVLSWEDMQRKLESNVTEEQFVVAGGEESLAEIAAANGIPQEVLLQRNPELADFGLEYIPEAGKSIKLANAQPLLQVQSVFRVQSTEEIPFVTIEQPNDQRAYGTRLPVQEGSSGMQEVWDDYVYIDGELRDRVRVSELTNILQPPVDKIVEVGTNQQTMVGLDDYMFPVPSSVWSSRGISGYHRGLDINAPTGEPMFACQAGTVITAGWHYSYGYHIIIDHGNGMVTLYAHCSQLFVEAGKQVMQGDLIAAVGSTGNSSGPHLHLEFQLNGALQNPLNYITPPPGYRLGRG